jgi:hypothetical protein
VTFYEFYILSKDPFVTLIRATRCERGKGFSCSATLVIIPSVPSEPNSKNKFFYISWMFEFSL